MSQIAKWGKKTWNVSAVKVQGVEDLNFSFTQTADNNTSTEENKLTNQRGKELFPLKFSTVLCAGAGTPDIRAEIEDWQSLVTKVDYFFLGGKQLGPALQLRKVSVSDIQLDNRGNILIAKLSFEFKEYDQETSSVKATIPPLQVTATAESKTLKKLPNANLSTAKVTTIKVGDSVKVVSGTWANGVGIPQWVKNTTHKVSQISGDKILLGYPSGVCSWIFSKDVTLV